MAAEYISENENEKDNSKEENGIDWNKVQISYQKNKRDENTLGADYAVDHEIYLDYFDTQIGYLHFSEYKNVVAKRIHPALPDKKYDKLLYINNILVQSDFRGFGLGQTIYAKFGEIYRKDFIGWPVSQVFVNPVAEYAFMKEVRNGNIPKEAYTPELIATEYNEKEKLKSQELFDWLPNSEQKEFKEKMKDLKHESSIKTALADPETVDARNIRVDYTAKSETDPDEIAELEEVGASNLVKHRIDLTAGDGEEIGYMEFSQVENIPAEALDLNNVKGIIEKLIYIQMVQVWEKFQNGGFGYRLYEEFGKIYNQNFKGWPVARNFVNPVAEYTYRKAVSAGLVPEEALTEDYILRDYNDYPDLNLYRSDLAKDLRNKLPENVRGPEQWALRKNLRKMVGKLRKTANTIDMRNITFENELDTSDFYPLEVITASINGEQVGYMTISVIESSKELMVDSVEVFEEYQNLGIGQLLYKEFGKLYASKYNGWPVGRYFMNPIAEYAFRKAVSLGWVSENAITEDKIVRDPDDENANDLWQDLRQKLPKHLRGPEQWARVRDYRKRIEGVNEQMTRLKKVADAREKVQAGIQIEEEGYKGGGKRSILALHTGDEVGRIDFSEVADGQLSLDKVHVKREYVNYEVDTMMFEYLGSILSEEYSGWTFVSKTFEQPEFEVNFRKLVSQGIIPSSFLDNNNVNRNYDDEQNMRFRDLNDALPQSVQGKRTGYTKVGSSLLKDFRIQVRVADLRVKKLDLRKTAKVTIADLRRPAAMDLRKKK